MSLLCGYHRNKICRNNWLYNLYLTLPPVLDSTTYTWLYHLCLTLLPVLDFTTSADWLDSHDKDEPRNIFNTLIYWSVLVWSRDIRSAIQVKKSTVVTEKIVLCAWSNYYYYYYYSELYKFLPLKRPCALSLIVFSAISDAVVVEARGGGESYEGIDISVVLKHVWKCDRECQGLWCAARTCQFSYIACPCLHNQALHCIHLKCVKTESSYPQF